MVKIDLVKLIEEVNKEEMIEGGVHKIFALTCLYKFIEKQEEAIDYAHSSLQLPTKKESITEFEKRLEDIRQSSSFGANSLMLLSYRLGFEEYDQWLRKR